MIRVYGSLRDAPGHIWVLKLDGKRRQLPRWRYDYYDIALPLDLEPGYGRRTSGDITVWFERMEQHAIDAARDRAKLWCSNCQWQVVASKPCGDEYLFRVRRKRNRF
jgi:hypothetical protein